MHFESHQTEDYYREEHYLKLSLINLIKSCQQNLDHSRAIIVVAMEKKWTQCPGCMHIGL